MRNFQARRRPFLLFLGISAVGLTQLAYADTDTATTQAQWKPSEIRYSYIGFTTAYDCLAFESKMERILRTLGAHPQTKVRATGCPSARPSRNFFVTITTATPEPVAQADVSRSDQSRKELLDKLGAGKAMDQQFPAAWQRIDLSEDRRLDLKPGDCELMDGLRKHVLPKLGMKIDEDRVVCTPKAVSIDTPKLVVSALVPVKSADTG